MSDEPQAPPNTDAVSSYTTDARPRASCLFLALPIGFAALILLGYVVLFSAGMVGFAAGGERVAITLDTCPEAHEQIQARAEMMGLGDPQWTEGEGTLILEATLPATPAAKGVPATLARGGDFAIRAGQAQADGELILEHKDMIKAEFSTKELGNPLIMVKLTREGHKQLEAWMEANNQQHITVWVDDEPILQRPAEPPFRRQDVDIRAEGEDGQENMTRAVNWALVMTHGPLPCETRVRETRVLDGA